VSEYPTWVAAQIDRGALFAADDRSHMDCSEPLHRECHCGSGHRPRTPPAAYQTTRKLIRASNAEMADHHLQLIAQAGQFDA
jgi:hypothetical protein